MANKVSLNDTFKYEFSFSQEDVENFAKASGDFNPIHLDNEFAKQTIFKRRIIHGFLGASIFSRVFGTIFPGSGTIYLKQDLKFFKPMFTDEIYLAVFDIVDVNSEKKRALVKTVIKDQNQETTISGEALIQNDAIG
jgi:3-hydroxybutyryl-CoA dehydratase